MNLTLMISELRLAQQQVDETILAFQRLAAGRGRPPAWMAKVKRRGRPPGSKNKPKNHAT